MAVVIGARPLCGGEIHTMSEPVCKILETESEVWWIRADWEDVQVTQPFGEGTQHEGVALEAAVFVFEVVVQMGMQGGDDFREGFLASAIDRVWDNLQSHYT